MQLGAFILFFKKNTSQGECNKPKNMSWSPILTQLISSLIHLSLFAEMFDTETATRLTEGTLHAGEDK